MQPQTIFLVAGACMTLVAMGGILMQKDGGWPTRFPGFETIALKAQIVKEENDAEWQQFNGSVCFVADVSAWGKDNCYLTRHSSTNALLWGDSFANNYAFGLFHNVGSSMNVLQYTSPQCPPIIGYEAASRPQCTPFIRNVTQVIRDYDIRTVILAANWASYVKRRKMTYADITKTVGFLQRLGLRVVLIGQSPEFVFAFPDEYFFKRYGSSQKDGKFFGELSIDPRVNNMIAAARPDAFFDPMAMLCQGNECIFKEDRSYLFSDYGHYTSYGSRLMVGYLLKQLNLSAELPAHSPGDP
jgi:hypothetical protein